MNKISTTLSCYDVIEQRVFFIQVDIYEKYIQSEIINIHMYFSNISILEQQEYQGEYGTLNNDDMNSFILNRITSGYYNYNLFASHTHKKLHHTSRRTYFKQIINVPFDINDENYIIPLTIDVYTVNGVPFYDNVSYNHTLFPEYTCIKINKLIDTDEYDTIILDLLAKEESKSSDVAIEVHCKMICRIDLYVMDVFCKCKVEMHGYDKYIDTSTIKYFDINVLCLIESFTNPIEWSFDGDTRTDRVDYIEEWNEIKQSLIDRIHDGYYNYELAYKSLNLVTRSTK